MIEMENYQIISVSINSFIYELHTAMFTHNYQTMKELIGLPNFLSSI